MSKNNRAIREKVKELIEKHGPLDTSQIAKRLNKHPRQIFAALTVAHSIKVVGLRTVEGQSAAPFIWDVVKS